jgi:mono/diheme cytochrome c family protein|tara:strand:+ start:167 stop:1495 length:1329 start_codon:yes stop_codon:yes gene_type:complete
MKLKTSMLGLAGLVTLGVQAQAQTHNADDLAYNGEVGRIINENCVVCHREGGIGPMQFETYDQVRPWAPLIQMKVASREMPPYAYDHGIGIQDLQGDWRLEQSEIDTLVAWVNAGSPQGDPEKSLPPLALGDPEAWSFEADFGAPDAIIPSVAIDIPANGNDLWHKHLVPTGLTEDRCIRAVQVKPRGEAKAVVHHANSNVVIDGGREGMLTEYAMGKWGEIVPEGVCRILPGNAEIRWDIHMFPGGLGAMAPGSVIKDNVVEIGLWLYSDEESKALKYKQDLSLYRLGDQDDLVVPPNGYAMTQGFHSFDHPVRLDSFQPHGHLRMNAASLEIFYPETGRTEQVSQVSKWSATWHHSHLYSPEAAPLIPAGAVIVLKQWYDNTAENPNNPDPDLFVMGGSRTGDEMTHAWLAITHLDDEGFETLVAERKAQEARSMASAND